jgi:hypothetical protein
MNIVVVKNKQGLYWNGGFDKQARWVSSVSEVHRNYRFTKVSQLMTEICDFRLDVGESIHCINVVEQLVEVE